MKAFGRAVRLAVLPLAGLALAWGCTASSDTSFRGGVSSGGTNGVADGATDGPIYTPDVPTTDGADSAPIANPLCGQLRCVPDDPESCSHYVPPAGGASGASGSGGSVGGAPGTSGGGGSVGGAVGQGGASGVAGQAGVAGEAGAAGAGSGDAGAATGEGGSAGQNDGVDGGVSGAAAGGSGGGVSGSGSGASGSGNSSGVGGASSGTSGSSSVDAGLPDASVEPAVYGCHVERSGSEPAAACALSGAGSEDASCGDSSDCLPGLGCVGDSSPGQCRPFCCVSGDSCAHGSYCAERTLRDPASAASSSALLVPVCVVADNCDLSVPYPCPSGADCACQGDTACMVVRPDGTTTCAVPGSGTLGQPCPCAWGHVCSQATNTCLKLCATNRDDCGSGKCQVSAELPAGFGVCVGSSNSDAG